MPDPLYVTRPVLPALEALQPLLEEIWASRQLTNNGPLVDALEAALADYLGVEFLTLTANCTLASIVALRALDLGGEIVTTPFSFVATSNSIVLAGAEPVFADVDPDTFNLDPESVARRITPRTRAILAVHSYGHPCDLEGLQAVADQHGLPLLYDAAHTFGVRVGDRSLVDFGDGATLSFHATKVFNTFEGGAVVCHDAATHERVRGLINHGMQVTDDQASEIGLNAKLSELHAAVGLTALPTIECAIAARGRLVDRYVEAFEGVDGIRPMRPPQSVRHNHYMFPVFVEPPFALSRECLFAKLRADGIVARRYFHPLISDMPAFAGLPTADPAALPGARYCADHVLCLPLYPELEDADQDRVIESVLNAAR